MALLSFAHLKNKKHPENKETAAPSPSGPSQVVRKSTDTGNAFPGSAVKPAGGILSFAHLKNKKQARENPRVNTPEKINPEKKEPCRSMFRIPAVMPTALLISVNYCQGCGRFLPASEIEKTAGNPYGRCYRGTAAGEDGKEAEVWKVIPAKAKVKRCFYYLNWGK